MNQEKFINLTKSGESYTVEYKTCTENVSESVYESICSFLNHSGGYILLGVKDNGEIKGINSDKAESSKRIIQKIRYLYAFFGNWRGLKIWDLVRAILRSTHLCIFLNTKLTLIAGRSLFFL
ncbi:MAG: ATP-binding protein [Bacteroidales bacterium]|nr:ATP-binding protein [Bacteroidales bacterium]